MLNAGAMRHQVRIEQRTTLQQESGEPRDFWLLFAERRAERVVLSAREAQAQQQQAGRALTLFRLRYLDGVLPAMRLVSNEKLYDIKSAVDPDGRGAELLITCEEQVGEAAPE